MNEHAIFIMDPDGDPQSRPALTIEIAWWFTNENQAHHVMAGNVWLGNIEFVDGKIVVSKQAAGE